MTFTATLKNWTVLKAGSSLYLKGNAFSHINPDYAADGDMIVTSAILAGRDGYVVTHCGSYKVG